MSPKKSYFSESLARGLRVIRAFSGEAPVLNSSEVAKRSGLTRAAARRYLLTLQDLHYVGRNGERFYLRPRVLELGHSYLSSVDLERFVQPFVLELAEATHERSSFGVLEDWEVLFVARASAKRVQDFSISIGGRVAAHSTSLGQVLLAGLDRHEMEQYFARAALEPAEKKALRLALREVHDKGWAAMDWHKGLGIASVAVPIRDRAGATLAALNVMQYPGHTSRTLMARKFLALLRSTGDRIEAALNVSGHFALGTRRWNSG